MATQEEMRPVEWVNILSKDGYVFIVPREVAMMSGTLKNMLSIVKGGRLQALVRYRNGIPIDSDIGGFSEP